MNMLNIVITLSGEKIFMEHTSGERRGVYAPLPGMLWPLTLERFTGKKSPAIDAVLSLKIMNRIERFIESYSGPEGENLSLSDIRIVFLVENSISDNEVENIERDYRIRGISVKIMRPDLLIAEHYRQEHGIAAIVIANSNGNDLDLSVSLSSQPREIARLSLPGHSNDPRANGLAEKIWDLVSDQTIDLRMENEMEELLKAANRFLESGRAEMDDRVILSDGYEYEFSLQRSMIPRDKSIHTEIEFSRFLGERAYLTDRSQSILVLRGEAIGNTYLKSLLSPGFMETVEMTGAVREAIMRLAISDNDLSYTSDELVPKAVAIDTLPTSPQLKRVIDHNPIDQNTSELIPVSIDAKVEKVKTGFFSKRNILKIKISSPGNPKLKWRSVLIVQPKPLTSIQGEYIVKEYDRGERLPVSINIELPIKNCGDANRLRIYFKPHPEESVGINNAYSSSSYTINI